MLPERRVSRTIANGLMALAIGLRAVDLWPSLAQALQPYFPLYAASVMLSVLGVLILERAHLRMLFISRYRWRVSLGWGLAGGTLLGLGVGLLLARMRFGIHWLPGKDILPTLGAAFAAALFEELMFRSYTLSRLAETPLGPVGANVTQAILFVVVHPRYFVQGDWLMILSLTIFALGTGVLTLRTQNVLGAIAAHVGLNFMIFVPIGAVVTRL